MLFDSKPSTSNQTSTPLARNDARGDDTGNDRTIVWIDSKPNRLVRQTSTPVEGVDI